MGRGRAKAKQTKVARELKYGGIPTDLNALRSELVHPDDEPVATAPVVEEPVEDEQYADVYAKYADDDDEASAG
jgi:Protein of unknown function (DUF3073)